MPNWLFIFANLADLTRFKQYSSLNCLKTDLKTVKQGYKKNSEQNGVVEAFGNYFLYDL